MSAREPGALRLGLGIAALGALAAGAVWAGRRATRFSFRGKAVLITGGSRGLGLVLARALAREGARLALCARDGAELERAASSLRAQGAQVVEVRCDLTRRDQIEQMVRAVSTQLGGIDVLVNNAGIIQVGPLAEQRPEDFEEAMAIHFWAPLHATLAVIPGMRARRSGRIVNIASIGGKLAVPHMAPYCASKFALVGLSSALQSELAGDGVRVTTVCPGMMRTGSHVHARFKGKHRAEYAWFTLGNALPLTSVSAERAARRIVAAARRGQAELVIGWSAKLAVRLQALMPETTAFALRQVAAVLPEPGGIGSSSASGRESASGRSLATTLSDRAAIRNNEV
jgi:short-subunit dehydrogenase